MESDQEKIEIRLDAIETQWSLVQRAHHATLSSDSSADEARSVLLLRYAGAIRGFVKAIVRDENDTDEVAQDVFLRLMSGDFAGADPNRGRFRDLLKTATRNMIKNYWALRSRRKERDIDTAPEQGQESEPKIDQLWIKNWRDNILDIAWSRLQQFEQNTQGNISYQLLKIRSDHPDWGMNAIAIEISGQTNREINANNVRQQLRRARMRFAEYVVEEVTHGLPDSDPQRVVDELINLDLYEHVKSFIPDDLAR